MSTDNLSHTSWKCKYHIVFAPKFRRKEIYGALRREIGMILRELCKRKDVEVIKIEEDISTSIEDEVEYPYFFTSLEKSIIQQTEENKENENQQNNGTTF